MDPSTRAMLNDAEQALLREATDSKLARLDEDALIDLHIRIRRARNKYVKMHRRRGAAQVGKDRSRTRASGAVSRTAVKAETFEEALGRVSARLAVVAAEAAEDLKAERLARARGEKAPASKAKRSGGAKPRPASATPKAKRSPIDQKRNASARGSKKRAQARRDAKR